MVIMRSMWLLRGVWYLLQRCVSVTQDLHFKSYLRDGVFSTAQPACFYIVETEGEVQSSFAGFKFAVRLWLDQSQSGKCLKVH